MPMVDDHARGPSHEIFREASAGPRLEREVATEYLFYNPLEKRRRRAEPQRMRENEMICGADDCLGLDNGGRTYALLGSADGAAS
jgi:hypothetical protein